MRIVDKLMNRMLDRAAQKRAALIKVQYSSDIARIGAGALAETFGVAHHLIAPPDDTA